MPYVNDRSDSDRWPVLTSTLNGGLFGSIDPSIHGRVRKQYGWRSGREGLSPYDPPLLQGGSWGSLSQEVNSLSRIEAATTPSPEVRDQSLPVHDRDYTELSRPLTVFPFSGKTEYGHDYTIDVAAGYGYNFTIPFPSALSQEQMRADLDQLMRAVRPTKPSFGLARALGELRDFPRLVRHATEIATLKASGFVPGKAWLSYNFGFAPMANDIAKGASAIISAKQILEQFLRDSGRLVRRRVTLPTSIEEVSPFGSPGIYIPPRPIGLSVTVKSVLPYDFTSLEAAAFGSYEYFVGDPTGVLGRLSEAEAKAQKLLGTNITPQVVWDLVPWTWMVGWFVDISGLLGYQNDVSDYSLALRRAGTSIVSTITMSSSVTIEVKDANGRKTMTKPVFATGRRHVRQNAGSPYGIVSGWDGLNPFQLSILTALGLSRRGW